MRRSAVAILTFAVGALHAPATWAHDAGSSRGGYRVEGAAVHTVQTFASADLASAFREIDVDHDGVLSASEVEQGSRILEAGIVDLTEIEADDDPCVAHVESVRIEAVDAVQLRASFTCPGEPAHLTVACGFLDRLPRGHLHLGTIGFDGHETSAVATQTREAIDADAPKRKSRRGATTALMGAVLGSVGLARWWLALRRRRQSRADM